MSKILAVIFFVPYLVFYFNNNTTVTFKCKSYLLAALLEPKMCYVKTIRVTHNDLVSKYTKSLSVE